MAEKPIEYRNMTKLIFGLGNAKLSKAIATFSLPSGHTCSGAKECLSKADRITGKISDGKHMNFRCFAATEEAVFPSVRKSRWDNYEKLKEARSIENMGQLIQDSLPKDINIIRLHVGGDFYSEAYFLAWLNVALNNPFIVFYGYTKMLPFLIKYKTYIPDNFRFTASKGGIYDNLISKNGLKYSEVVFSVKEAKQKKLEIDHDDSLCLKSSQSFALLLHSTQQANSLAASSMRALRKSGWYGYGKSQSKELKSKSFILYIPVISVNVTNKSIPFGIGEKGEKFVVDGLDTG
jgi:hypothetical protein